MKRVFFVAVGFFGTGVAVFALFVLFLTALIAYEGGFKYREVYSERSTDGSLRVVVRKRVAFPAYDLVDPSVVVRAELNDLGTHEIVASSRVSLIEDSDFAPPVVRWEPGEVRLTGFDRRTNQTVVLQDPRLSSIAATR